MNNVYSHNGAVSISTARMTGCDCVAREICHERPAPQETSNSTGFFAATLSHSASEKATARKYFLEEASQESKNQKSKPLV